jgi:TRAP-type C4-dicarboxylate transport system substrate-binding protein
VYRASVPRTSVLVAALFSTVAATGVFAREFRTADTRSEDHPTVHQALRRLARLLGRLIADRTGGRHQIRTMPFQFRSIEHLPNVMDGPTGQARLCADRSQWQRGVT